jgi:hypothetical protein
MASPAVSLAPVEYRNFNICPHCEWWGVEPTLYRMSEGMPMVSRSDGRNFHLLLADRPLPFPVEKDDPANRLSLCFWYVYENGRSLAGSTVVILPDLLCSKTHLFRQIEFVADLLVEELLRHQSLRGLYNLQGNSLQELRY